MSARSRLPRVRHGVLETNPAVAVTSSGELPASAVQDAPAVGREAVRVDDVPELRAALNGNHFATSNLSPFAFQKPASQFVLHDGQGFTVSP